MLQPVGKRVLILPIEETHGSLIMTHKKPSKFTVVNTGDEVTKVKAGDTVFLEKHYGVEIEHEGEKFQCIDESCILAKL